MPLSEVQLRTIEIVERAGSALSIVGIATIIITFCASPSFRNPIHRLILVNTVFNAFDITATMISLSGPRAGDASALCQFQGFLLQMFPVADVLWTFIMACDVFLIVFRRYDARALRKLELRYIVVVTILAFIPAFVFLFINTPDRGHMYGSVTLWCAIAPKWVLYRIVFYYVPIWVLISVTMVLYCVVGVEVLKRRRALQAVSSDTVPLDAIVTTLDKGSSDHPSLATTVGSQVDSHPSFRMNSRLTYQSGETSRRAQSGTISFQQYIVMPMMIFIVLLTVWVAPSTNRISSFIDPSFESFPLLIAVGLTGSLRGFWNGLVFITIGMKARKRRRYFMRSAPSRTQMFDSGA